MKGLLATLLLISSDGVEWLNSQLFVATLSDVPDTMRLAEGPKENDRLIQIYRVF
jgi:hypothetical protein